MYEKVTLCQEALHLCLTSPTDRPRAMNADAVVASPCYRITIYIVELVIIKNIDRPRSMNAEANADSQICRINFR